MKWCYLDGKTDVVGHRHLSLQCLGCATVGIRHSPGSVAVLMSGSRQQGEGPDVVRSRPGVVEISEKRRVLARDARGREQRRAVPLRRRIAEMLRQHVVTSTAAAEESRYALRYLVTCRRTVLQHTRTHTPLYSIYPSKKSRLGRRKCRDTRAPNNVN